MVNKITYISSIQSNNALYEYCIVCLPLKVKFPSVILYLTSWGNSSSSDISIANIFYQSLACVIILLTLSFAEQKQKFLMLMKSSLSLLSFMNHFFFFCMRMFSCLNTICCRDNLCSIVFPCSFVKDFDYIVLGVYFWLSILLHLSIFLLFH